MRIESSLLRADLEYITGGVISNVLKWTEQIDAIRDRHQHHIAIIEECPSKKYNCFAYALGLVDSTVDGARTAQSEFISYLIHLRLLQENPDGIVGVYFRDDSPRHAAMRSGEKYLSKWGTGSLVEHEMWEVPLSYGSSIKHFDLPSRELLEQAFSVWSREATQPSSDLPSAAE